MAMRQIRRPVVAWRGVCVLVVLGAWVAQAGAQIDGARFRVRPRVDGTDVPVHASVRLPRRHAGLGQIDGMLAVELTCDETGQSVLGQIVRTDGQAELWWIVPEIRKGRATEWRAESKRFASPGLGAEGRRESFQLRRRGDASLRVFLGRTPAVEYMHARDTSTERRDHETYKVYHHVYSGDGNEQLTKGPGGKYTHHRGIFIGWRKVGYRGKSYDFWHMNGVTQEHRKLLVAEAGALLATHTARIEWDLSDGETVLTETRRVDVVRRDRPGVWLIDVTSTLEAGEHEVVLDGDPEHAGCQFRAHNGVHTDKNSAAKYLFHAEGVNPKKDRDLPWVCMSFGLSGERYTVQHMSHPSIPKGNVYSAYRSYGRFGAFFKKTIPAGRSLTLRYRFHVAKGDLPETRDEPARRYAWFAEPPKVESVR